MKRPHAERYARTSLRLPVSRPDAEGAPGGDRTKGMRKSRLAQWAQALLLLVVAGCDSSAEGGGTGSSVLERKPLTEEQKAACAAFAKASCARKAECSPYNISIMYGTLELCEATSARECETELSLPGGTQTLERIQSCTASQPTAACARAFGLVIGDESCSSPPGTLGSDAACVSDSQCASDNCELGDSTHCYSCQSGPPKTAPLGAACDPVEGPGCSEGLCYFDSCVKLAHLGEACDANAICEAFLPCRDGVCSPALGDGADCTQDADCVLGWACTSGKCAESPPNLTSVGTSCGFGTMTMCALFTQYCKGPFGSAGTCQLVSQEGEPCGQDVFGDDSCASGLECRDGTCQLEALDACI